MIALGCDHGGYELKQEIIKYLEENNLPFKDFGCYDNSSVDYPIYARKVTDAITHGECDKGILICGTGIGISIAANKVPGIRAALCTDCFCAEATRLHNDANILCMGGRVVGPGLAVKITDTFLNTPFSNDERHIRRINLIENRDPSENPLTHQKMSKRLILLLSYIIILKVLLHIFQAQRFYFQHLPCCFPLHRNTA